MFITIQSNVVGIDVKIFVKKGMEAIKSKVNLPPD